MLMGQLGQHFYSFIKGRQEELLNQAAAVTPEETTNNSKIKTLQDLFRPPVDIIFKGTFEAVCIVIFCCCFSFLFNMQHFVAMGKC